MPKIGFGLIFMYSGSDRRGKVRYRTGGSLETESFEICHRSTTPDFEFGNKVDRNRGGIVSKYVELCRN